MTTYNDVIMQFFYEAVPTPNVDPRVRFEAVSKAVLGTKQRRYGPAQSPEAQVLVRDVIQDAIGGSRVLNFFSPWGASKQTAGAPLDLAEFMALKQLRCLAAELRGYGVTPSFSFRLEDLTDRYLFGDGRVGQIQEYVREFRKLASTMLNSGMNVYLESQFVAWDIFESTANVFAPIFFRYLRREETSTLALREIGWTGDISDKQLAYYTAANSLLYPGQDPLWHTARYFAATLARVKLKATCAPLVSYVTVAFTHPVPDNPISRPRVYYRTIPERYTNNHKSPWLAAGYFQIDGETNACTPKLSGPGDNRPDLVPQVVQWERIEINAPYVVV